MPRGEEFSLEETGGLGAWLRQKPFSILVIAGGLLYIGLALLVLSVPLIVMGALMAPGGEFILVIFLFVALFLIAAVFTLREARWAYVLGSAVSVLFALLYSSVIASTVSNPADDYFWLVMSLLPVTFLARVRFAGVSRVSDRGMTIAFGLPTPRKSPRLSKVEEIAPGWHGHWMRVTNPDDLDDEVLRWLQESFA